MENTTEIFTQKDKKLQQKKLAQRTDKPSSDITQAEENNTLTDTYTLSDANNVTHRVTLQEDKLSLSDTDASVILMMLFPPSAKPFPAEMTSLAKLQKKFRKKLFIASVSSEKINNTASKTHCYISANKDNKALISRLFAQLNVEENTSEPLSIIYKDGAYFSHFEGAAPIEMLTYDVQKAIEN